jgi:stearoyl-CoA desaturase (Delta-9 desaturase)
MPKTQENIEADKVVDMTDIENDPVVMFQYKHYNMLTVLFGVVAIVIPPVYLWNESWNHAFHIAVALRVIWCIHMTWCINSVSHMFGDRTYDKTIKPTQSAIMSFFNSEGWHNYHHAFPWDYRADEFSGPFRYFFGPSTAFIDLCAKIGLASDLKIAPPSVIENRKKNKGEMKEHVPILKDTVLE